MQLAGEAATALIVEMTRSGWEAARAAIARFFDRGGEDTATEELRLVDAGQQELVQSASEDRDAIAERLQQALTIQLAAFLQKHSDGAEDLKSLIEQAGRKSGATPGFQANATGNTNSQVIISGDSISAGGSFNYNAPEGDR
ncbi:hypothetical protein [Streptomyces chartreusis]|uniref:Uncharacterized protein n=1 Tax=Streptomyces chartreusis TaxID=1969 RepID=A0A7H8T4D8_STRCX|nr:hypothetical protein [Streptomyces chartreusis]QKZ18359.1 hypothetical protein HUT05_13905 [Streptomyces chartreusis]